MKILLPLLLLFISLSAFAEGRENIYKEKLNTVLSNECRIVVYANLSKTAFTKISFAPESSTSFEDFAKAPSTNLEESKVEKFSFNETFGAGTKHHNFYVEENNIYVKYEVKNPVTGRYELADNLIFENVDSCS